jgi:hypothetical protein
MEVKYNQSHHCGGTPAERIANRLRNSGAGAKPNTTVQTGNSPQRVFHNIHNAGHPIAPGTQPKEGEGR